MRIRVRNPASAPAVALLTAALSPASASASGFALLEQSASRLGSAFAGTTAAADDAATIYFNPAGLAHLERPQAIVVASGIGITSEFRNGGSQPALLQPLGGEGGATPAMGTSCPPRILRPGSAKRSRSAWV